MLEKLRSKPDHIKKTFSLVLTIIIFSIIVFVWVSSRENQSQKNVSMNAMSPLASLVEMMSEVISEAKERVSGMPSYTENINGTATNTPAKKDSVASSTTDFNISGIVIIDHTVKSASTSPKLTQ